MFNLFEKNRLIHPDQSRSKRHNRSRLDPNAQISSEFLSQAMAHLDEPERDAPIPPHPSDTQIPKI